MRAINVEFIQKKIEPPGGALDGVFLVLEVLMHAEARNIETDSTIFLIVVRLHHATPKRDIATQAR